MKSLYTILFSFTIILTIAGQSEWQEFLSHERSTSVSNGHLLIDGKMHVAYIDALKKIEGNQKPEIGLNYPAYMYQRIKTTRTGIDSKELLLLEAFDYDIPGLGLVSLRNNNGTFWGKHQFGYEDFDFEYQFVPDGILSPSGLIYDQIINHNNDLIKLENGMIETTSPSPVQGFHEGLDHNFFAIKGDTLMSYTDAQMTPVLILESHDNLLNDPYTNSLVIQIDNQLLWYSYDDYTLTASQSIEPNTIGLQFFDGGLYQLVKTDLAYKVYKYTSPEIPAFETIHELPFDDITGFDISSFEVDDQDIYYVGVNGTAGFGISFHYVQKRTIGQTFEPLRHDLAVDTFSVVEIDDPEWQSHSYSFTVRNNGESTINSFALSSPTLPVFHPDYSFIRVHFDETLALGETFTFTDSLYLPMSPSQISIKVSGVNYGFDGNNANDEYTADVISLSNKNISKLTVEIYPNPSSDILNIKGDMDSQSTIIIYDNNGQIVKYDRLSFDRLDISQLPIGFYNLVVKTSSNSQSLPFIKK